ncbi:Myb/SANT-like domain-containing protein [Tanacetum coccineum]
MQQATKDKKDGTTATKLSWTHQMDNAFIEAMLKEKENGNKLDGSFTSQAYMNMVEELSKSLKMEIRKVHLQNRLKTLKAHFSLYNDIFRGVSLSGFSWDPITKLMNAEDEVWEALIKEKPEAAKLRTKPIHHYNEMLELFAKDRATGEGAVTAKERNNRIKQNGQTTETIDELDDTDQFLLSLFYKKRKLEEDDVFISKITSSLDNISSAIDRSTKVMENSRPHVYSEAEIYKVLELMGLERHEIPSAYLFLVDNPDKTRALFGAPNEMRLTILATMMA